MASILYTHGDTHEINGIICKQEFVPAESVHVLLGAGYFASPEDLAQSLMDAQEEKKEKVDSVDVEPETGGDKPAEDPGPAESEKPAEPEADDEQELESLKARAKELGLKGYGNCGIEALRAKIKEAEEKQEG